VDETVDVCVHLEDNLPDAGVAISRRVITGKHALLRAVVQRLLVDCDVDGVWYADDDTEHEDQDDGQLRPVLIAPYDAYLRKPAAETTQPPLQPVICNRIVKVWYSLPAAADDFATVRSFARLIERVDLSEYLVY